MSRNLRILSWRWTQVPARSAPYVCIPVFTGCGLLSQAVAGTLGNAYQVTIAALLATLDTDKLELDVSHPFGRFNGLRLCPRRQNLWPEAQAGEVIRQYR